MMDGLTDSQLKLLYKTEGIIQGRIEGKIECILELLEDKGIVPEELRELIRGQHDIGVLSQWVKLASHVWCVEEFAEEILGE